MADNYNYVGAMSRIWDSEKRAIYVSDHMFAGSGISRIAYFYFEKHIVITNTIYNDNVSLLGIMPDCYKVR